MPSKQEIASCRWMTADFEVYSSQYTRAEFHGPQLLANSHNAGIYGCVAHSAALGQSRSLSTRYCPHSGRRPDFNERGLSRSRER